MSDKSEKRERPLSPHLQAYKPQMTSVLSIFHRMAGVALAIGTFLVVAVLVTAAMGEEEFNVVRDFIASPLGTFMIFGWSAALFYHMCNGIRHLFWDMGYLFKLKNAYAAGYVVLISATLLTAVTWALAFNNVSKEDTPALSDKLVEAIIPQETKI